VTDDARWRLEAHAAIHDLYGRWSHALDRGASSIALDDFVPDGVLWASDRGSYRGHEELAAIFAKRAGKTMHVINSIVVESVEGPHARSHAYFQLVDLDSGRIVAWGQYDDEVTHHSGRWRWSVKAVDFRWRADGYASEVTALALPDQGSPNPVGGFSISDEPVSPAGTQRSRTSALPS
jgi:hypothetical protein